MITATPVYDRIFLTGIRTETVIGVLDSEKKQPQPVDVDLVLFLLPILAAVTDNLNQTVSYARVYEQVRQICLNGRFELLERLAGAIAEQVLQEHEAVMRLEVTVRKPQAPLPGPFNAAGVTLYRSRGDYNLKTVADLSLGANLGDRLGTLRHAVQLLEGHPAIEANRISSVYETTPVGPVAQPDFLNMAVRLCTTLDPWQLLCFCQTLEAQAGRERLTHSGPRTLDIDLLRYGSLVTRSATLTLPHPRMMERDFVRIPLQEIETGEVCSTSDVRFACQLFGKRLE
jgi:dihydroneopterin aldolase/2-amino-4-hydroxy-6-hydroxymethyldihydropteridine diphosphokinase